MRFLVLGPLHVESGDGQTIAVGAARERALVLRLLLEANRTVTADRLVEDLWGEEAPRSALQTVRVYVSRLRKALAEPDRIRTTPTGYLLALGPGECDVLAFESLLHQAGELVIDRQTGQGAGAGSDPQAAARLLTEALGLWRGTPFADVADAVWARPDVARLEECRLTALEDRISLDLDAGRHASVVAELEELCAREPLRERLWAARMLALYRSGRAGDALAAFSDLRDHLVEELGLEPSAELRELQRRVLGEDPTLQLPRADSGTLEVTGEVVTTVSPREPPDRNATDPHETPVEPAAGNLPVAATRFLGRTQELEEVAGLLWRTETRLVTLTGAGGSGKTRLAHRVAELSAQDYPDGAWFVAFSDIADPDLIALTICQTLGIAEQPNVTPTEQMIAWCAERTLLLLLDNLEQLTAGTAILGELLASCRGVTLLATSREPLRLAGEQQYEVPVLDPGEAVELFSARAHAVRPQLTVDGAVAAAICERLDRLPLAIELAAARTKTLPPDEILARLEQRLPVLATGPRDAPRRHQTLRATIDWSYDHLTRPEQDLFCRLAVFSGGFTLSAAEAVCEANLETLHALTDRSLIRVDERGRYSMLQTLQEYALEQLTDAGDLEALRRRHAHWCLELLPPGMVIEFAAQPSALIVRAAREVENLRAALEWATTRESETAGWLIASVWRPVSNRKGLLREADHWIGFAREHQAEYPRPLQARVLNAAAVLAFRRGARADAVDLCAGALAIYRELGDAPGICGELSNQAAFAAVGGDLVGARAALEEMVVHARAHAVPEALPTALANLGALAIDTGHLSEARELSEEALALAESTGRTEVTPILLINLAHLANLDHRLSDAAQFGHSAITIALEHNASFIAAMGVMQIAWRLAEGREPQRAARLLGAGIGFHESTGANLQGTDQVCADHTLRSLRAQLDEPTLQALLNDGRALAFEEAVHDALSESPLGRKDRESV